ncbi:MAG: UDP-N-acetylmuramoyl-tripeptide--D-alanyl-D-alanine ligase [Candidatus Krumholzibacteriota bacterium]|nr:UDP-N-acetylmuramoyl-tripeptide--D-alanyl-D-alanine ligase [Candidatus Krumholzibacteriota bacterium]
MIPATWVEARLGEAGLLLRSRAGGGAPVAGAVADSRRVRGGELFVALPGARTDGHAHAGAALAAGATAALLGDASRFDVLATEHPGAALYLVPDPLAALQALATARLGEVAPVVVAVTGTNGKTGTKDLCRALLATLGPVHASEGNYNNLVGLPLTLLGLSAAARYLVLEMGCSSFGEIEALCRLFPPRIGIVTNIGAGHLAMLGDLDGVARAKGELPAALPADGLCILGGDDAYAPALAARTRAPVKRFGFGPGNDLVVEDLGPAGPASRRLRLEGHELTLPRPARHVLLNAAAAWLAARHLGGEPAALAAAVPGALREGNRGALYRLGDITVMDDSYNANPDSLRAALRWLGEAPAAGRRWAALGDMLELGERSPALHRAVGEEAAGLGLDGLLAVGPLSRELVAGARAAGLASARHHDDLGSLAADLAAVLGPGDLLLVKGSRGMAMEGVLDALEASLGRRREELR